MRRSVVSQLAAVALLGVAGPAWGHVSDRAAATIHAPVLDTVVPRGTPELAVAVDPALTDVTASPVFWLVLVGLTASLVLASRSRRTLVTLLVAFLVVFAVEAGVHSVHHLGEPRDAVRCVVETVSSNLSGLAGEPLSVHGSTEPADDATSLELLAPVQRPLCPQGGRAPPLPA